MKLNSLEVKTKVEKLNLLDISGSLKANILFYKPRLDLPWNEYFKEGFNILFSPNSMDMNQNKANDYLNNYDHKPVSWHLEKLSELIPIKVYSMFGPSVLLAESTNEKVKNVGIATEKMITERIKFLKDNQEVLNILSNNGYRFNFTKEGLILDTGERVRDNIIGRNDFPSWQFYFELSEDDMKKLKESSFKATAEYLAKATLPLTKETAELKKAIEDYHNIDKLKTGKINTRLAAIKNILENIKKLKENQLNSEQLDRLKSLRKMCLAQAKELQRIKIYLNNKLKSYFPQSKGRVPLRRIVGGEFVTSPQENVSRFTPGREVDKSWIFEHHIKNNFKDVFLPPNGLLLKFKEGKAYLNETDKNSAGAPAYIIHQNGYINNQSYGFVMDSLGNIRLNQNGGHSEALSGEPVIAAGSLTFQDGKITHIDSNSGHYLPRMHHIRSCIKMLQKIDPSPLASDMTVGNYNNSIVLPLADFMKCDLKKVYDERVFTSLSSKPGKDSREYVAIMPTPEEIELLNKKLYELKIKLETRDKKTADESNKIKNNRQKQWLLSFSSQIKSADQKTLQEIIQLCKSRVV